MYLEDTLRAPQNHPGLILSDQKKQAGPLCKMLSISALLPRNTFLCSVAEIRLKIYLYNSDILEEVRMIYILCSRFLGPADTKRKKFIHIASFRGKIFY